MGGRDGGGGRSLLLLNVTPIAHVFSLSVFTPSDSGK